MCEHRVTTLIIHVKDVLSMFSLDCEDVGFKLVLQCIMLIILQSKPADK